MTEATSLQQPGTSYVDLANIDSMLNELAASADAQIWRVRSRGAVRRGAGDQNLSAHGPALALQMGSEVLATRIWSEGPKVQRDQR